MKIVIINGKILLEDTFQKEPELFQAHQRSTLMRFQERGFFNQLTVQE